MAGVYIHIPYCKKKCNYCDFYSIDRIDEAKNLVKAICTELVLRKNYLDNEKVDTIYFGGGTPSLLGEMQLDELLQSVYKNFNVDDGVEVSIEVNPDDVNSEFIKTIKTAGFNRVSIGVQSFSDKDLKFLGRRHNAQQAIRSVEMAFVSGITNISADLIFGIPGMSFNDWKKNLGTMISLPVVHISAYQLSYEEHTPLYNQLISRKIKETSDNMCWEQYKYLVDFLYKNDFIQYEISNFAKDKKKSKHNSSYWKGTKYLGVGPSAHSYDQDSRQWNVSDINQYLDSVRRGFVSYEKEELSGDDMYNEYIITRLRTIWGIDLTELEKEFGKTRYNHCFDQLEKYINQNMIRLKDKRLTLTTRGLFMSDMIFRELIITENA